MSQPRRSGLTPAGIPGISGISETPHLLSLCAPPGTRFDPHLRNERQVPRDEA